MPQETPYATGSAHWKCQCQPPDSECALRLALLQVPVEERRSACQWECQWGATEAAARDASATVSGSRKFVWVQRHHGRRTALAALASIMSTWE